MFHHRHFPRELVLSAASQIVTVKADVIWPVEAAAAAGVALALATVHAVVVEAQGDSLAVH